MPELSPQRPTGSKNMAVESKNDVTTQLSITASIPSDFSMEGKAILMDEIRKVPIKEVMEIISRMETCFLVQFIFA